MLRQREINLILTGPGIPFIAYAGALKSLEDNNIQIRNKVSVSGGSIIQSLIDEGYTANEMLELLKSYDLIAFKDFHRSLSYTHKGLLEGYNILSVLKEIFKNKKISPSSTIICTDIDSRNEKHFNSSNSNEYLYDVIRASLSIPILFEPHIINSRTYIDGGCSNNYPYEFFKDSDIPVFALKITSKQNIKKAKDQNMLEFFGSIIDQLIKSQEKKGLYNCNLIDIEIPYSNFDFNLNHEDLDLLFKLGYDSMYNFLKINNKKIF